MGYIKPVTNGNFTVTMDDREKNPWVLPYEVEVKRLKVGDYSVKGFEDIIAIEKKSGLGELFNDLAMSYRETFKRFLKKMSKHPVSVIVVQEELTEYNINRALKVISKKSGGRCKLVPATIHHWVSRITMEYGVPILFMDWRLVDVMLPELFKQSYRRAQEIR